MALSIPHLRRWFATAVIVVCGVVVAVYFHGRRNVQNALKQVPQKLNIDVQQSAQGFSVSKSEQGRTLFKLQASKAVQFKQGGRAELHDVTITIYGTDSSRFDQVYGKDFEYDPQTGNVTSKGEVSIDLQANPQGVANPDQAVPRELKNPIHLKTTDFVFNQKTGDAWTAAPVEFDVPQASGSAVGAKYNAKETSLVLQSRVRIAANGARTMKIVANRALLNKNPREVVLQHPRINSPQGDAQSEEAKLFLGSDNTLERAVATGDVLVNSHAKEQRRVRASHVTAQQLEVNFGSENRLETGIFSGDVRFESESPEHSQASAGRAVLSFGESNKLTKIHAEQQVRILQTANSKSSGQNLEATAPAMDLFFSAGEKPSRAETDGAPEIRVTQVSSQHSETRITADRFSAKFNALGRLSQVHGEAHTRVVTSAPPQKGNAPQPDRVSTSDSIDADFRPGIGLVSLTQQGHFEYTSGAQQAFAHQAQYTPADQMIALHGSPRIVDGGMETTADAVRLNRNTGEGFAEGDVKASYNDLKPEPGGALLASSDPVHVTADRMTARNSPAIATYNGSVRLWQDANMVVAPKMQFERDPRVVVADSTAQEKVSTTLITVDNRGKATPVDITADHLTYSDRERQARYAGGVTVQSTNMKLAANQMDVFFAPASGANQVGENGGRRPTAPSYSAGAAPSGPQALAKLDRIIASGSVVITQPTRRATGDKLTYTAADDKFVLTGGPPCIFDAERGKITGVSLTLYRTDDRVIVDGTSSSPAVTETRVVR